MHGVIYATTLLRFGHTHALFAAYVLHSLLSFDAHNVEHHIISEIKRVLEQQYAVVHFWEHLMNSKVAETHTRVIAKIGLEQTLDAAKSQQLLLHTFADSASRSLWKTW